MPYPLLVEDGPYDMIIIAPNAIYDAEDDAYGVFDYANFKTGNGLLTHVVRLGDIYTNYNYLDTAFDDEEYWWGEPPPDPPPIDNPMRIRNFIKEVYEAFASTSNPLKYIVICGYRGNSANEVPARNFTGFGQSDLYYSNLDGTWRYPGEPSWGTFPTGIYPIPVFDIVSDVYVGRITCQTESQFINYFTKAKAKLLSGLSAQDNKILFAGGYITSGSNSCYGHSSSFPLIVDQIVHPFFDVERYCNLASDDTRTGPYNGTDFFSMHNEGRAISFHCAHSNSNSFFNFSTTNYDSLDGIYHGFIASSGCLVASATPNIAGLLLGHTSGPIGIMATNKASYTFMSGIMRRMAEMIWQEHCPCISETLYKGKELIGPAYFSYSIRDALFIFQYYGDPSLEMSLHHLKENITFNYQYVDKTSALSKEYIFRIKSLYRINSEITEAEEADILVET